MNLLQDILVIDFSQFLSGPSAALRLADMGAQVIKIEKPVPVTSAGNYMYQM
jgi:crotonobetainyl-CoA:carnitine CoA-transferase CaiB-like acyl-CoA transferase